LPEADKVAWIDLVCSSRRAGERRCRPFVLLGLVWNRR